MMQKREFSPLPLMPSSPRHNPWLIVCYKSFQVFPINENTILFLGNENMPFLFCFELFYLSTVHWASLCIAIYRPIAHSSNCIIIIYFTEPKMIGITCVIYDAQGIYFHFRFSMLNVWFPLRNPPNAELWGQRVCVIYTVVYIANGPPEIS